MTALITGASAGIGKELAILFAKDKTDLILVARREVSLNELSEQLKETYGIESYVIAQDLSKPDSANVLYEKVKLLNLEVDYLVNNAAFGDYGEFVESNLARQEDMITLNITTLTKLTHLFGAEMKSRKRGTIFNIASTASFYPGSFMSTYFATKHYVLNFSESIAEELRPYNVEVSCLCPGPTQSEFAEVAGFGKPDPNSINPTSAEVAFFGYQKMKSKKVVSVHGIKNRINVFFVRFLSRKTLRKMFYKKMKRD